MRIQADPNSDPWPGVKRAAKKPAIVTLISDIKVSRQTRGPST